MIEILNKFIKLMIQFVDMFFNLYIDFDGASKISIGTLAVIFIFVVLAIWCILYAFGIVGKEE